MVGKERKVSCSLEQSKETEADESSSNRESLPKIRRDVNWGINK